MLNTEEYMQFQRLDNDIFGKTLKLSVMLRH